MEFANALNIATTLHAFDASAAYGRRSSDADRLHRGHVMLDTALLRQLRHARCMSQQDLANDCWRRNIPLSLTTIKRAELGRPVRFRIAREFARCFDVMVTRFVRAADAATACID